MLKTGPRARQEAEPAPAQVSPAARGEAAAGEHASLFCPLCHRRLAARSCKLVCACGYYMSCSDYY